jgi:1,2-diacylglycerol 3-beta-glucosyltransferase
VAVATVAWLGGASFYLLSLVAAAAVSPRHQRSRAAGSPLRTVILVPAHNEELGIQACVRALLEQREFAASHEVVVIADNCTDATATLATAEGAIVWERHDIEHRGKGRALAWAIARVFREFPDVEVIGIVDADCIASPFLCAGWSARFGGNIGAVQSDYRISNPKASGAAARRWAGFALMHRIRGGGKDALGLSCGLFGTGMAFSAELLRALPWTSFSITEDLEYHVRLVEAGWRVAFMPKVSVDSPAPLTEAEAQIQQMRWETGNVEIARRTIHRLISEGALRRDPQRIHLALEQLVPSQSIMAAGSLGATAVALVAGDRRTAKAAQAVLLAQVVYVIGGLGIAEAPAPVWRAIVGAPLLIARKVGQFAQIGAGRGATEWARSGRG